MARLFVVFFLILPGLELHAQEPELSTKSKKAKEAFDEANQYSARRQYTEAIQKLMYAIEKDPEFVEAYYLTGVFYKIINRFDPALEYLLKAEAINATRNIPLPEIDFHFGEIYYYRGNYEEAKPRLDSYVVASGSQRRIKMCEAWLINVNFALSNYDPDIKIDPRPLPENVNSFELQYFPMLTIDQQTLIFTRRLGNTPGHDEDIMISRMKNGVWGDPEPISDNINTQFNEGTTAISADGRTLIFTACQNRDREGSCDLFVSYKTGDVWSEPQNLGPEINTVFWESQPSLSADGRTLYFISDRHGNGRRDIYVSKKVDQNKWEDARNLGSAINSPGDEISPFIHANGVTLYFANDSRPGYGGYDIFYSNYVDGEWQEPVNLGNPINTIEDQVSLFITNDGSKGYYSHEENDAGRRRSYLYSFDMPDALKKIPLTSYVYGRVLNKNTMEPIAASVSLFDIAEGEELVASVNSDPVTGEYTLSLTDGLDYALYAQSSGFLFNTEKFSKERTGEPVQIDILLSPLERGATTTLNNIFFDFDSDQVRPESMAEINNIVSFMEENLEVEVVVEGHTDNVGDSQYNLDLSKRRAQAVVKAMIDKGTDPSRISSVGYGASSPKVDNTTEQKRAINRRIEFRIN